MRQSGPPPHEAGAPRRILLGNVFLARYLRSLGLSVSEIARRTRTTDVSVRQMLLSGDERTQIIVRRKRA